MLTVQGLEAVEDFATEFVIPHFDGEAEDILTENTEAMSNDALGIQLDYGLVEIPTRISHSCIGKNASNGAPVTNFSYFNDRR